MRGFGGDLKGKGPPGALFVRESEQGSVFKGSEGA